MFYFYCIISLILMIPVLFLFFMFLESMLENYMGYQKKRKLVFSVVLLITCILVSGFARNQSYVELKQMAHTGYCVYFNGELVDADKIAFSQYVIHIDEESKQIHLSQKPSRRLFYIPIIF